MKNRCFILASLFIFCFSIAECFTGFERSKEKLNYSNDSRFNIETLGKNGFLEFPVPINQNPKSAKLILFGNDKSKIDEYIISNGEWKENIFTGHIKDYKSIDKPAKLPGLIQGEQHGLKIKFTEGSYAFVGGISSVKNINKPSWKEVKSKAIVIGYPASLNLTPNKVHSENYALLINDKSAKAKNGEYSYGWYIEPHVSNTQNYRAVHIVKDGLLEEFALYAFENNDFRGEKGLDKFKLKSYKIKEIESHLSTFLPGYNEESFKPDIIALLINEAQRCFPSMLLGMKSSGHGSSVGIMNGFLNNTQSIEHALSLITEFRGRKIDFLDFATNCNVASLYNLISVSPYTNYVLASDLTRNSPIPTIGKRPDDGANYAKYFDDSNQKVSDILGAMMDSYEELYNNEESKKWYLTPDALKYGNSLSGWKQQLTLFDMNKFPNILKNIGGAKALETCSNGAYQLNNLYYKEESWKQIDFKTAIPLLFPAYSSFTADWDSFVLKQISNRNGLRWDTDAPKGVLLRTK